MNNKQHPTAQHRQRTARPRLSALAAFSTVFALIVMMAWGGYSSTAAFAAPPAGNGNGNGGGSTSSPTASPTSASPSPTTTSSPSASPTTSVSSSPSPTPISAPSIAASISSATLKGAEPASYSHATGGGTWADGSTAHVVSSLEGGKFFCGDTVTFLTKVVVPSNPTQVTPFTATLKLSFGFDSTGQSGVALVPLTALSHVQTQSQAHDSGVSPASNAATVSSATTLEPSAAKYTSGATQTLVVGLSGLVASSTTILRTDARIDCQDGASPTGNLQTTLTEVLVSGEKISAGLQTIPLQQVGDIALAPVRGAEVVKSETSITRGMTTLSSADMIVPGDVIHYAIAVRNSGNVPLLDFTVTDFGATNLVCGVVLPSTLLVGGTISCTAQHTIAQGDIDAGSYSNTARANSTTGSLAVSSNAVTTNIPAARVLTTTIAHGTDVSRSHVGDIVHLTVTVKNNGNVAIAGAAPQMTGATLIGCSAQSLAPGEEMTCSAERTLYQADLDRGYVTASPNATATNTTGLVVHNAAALDTLVDQAPELSIVETITSTANSHPGHLVNYLITVTNVGNVTLDAVTVTDLNAVLDALCTPRNAVAPGQSFTCTATHPLTQADVDAGTYANPVTTQSTQTGNTVYTATVPLTISAAPHLDINKEQVAPFGADAVGEAFFYKITVHNAGNVTVHNIEVTDPTADALTGDCTASSLAYHSEIYCYATHVLTQEDLDAGYYSNTATVTPSNKDANGADVVTSASSRADIGQHFGLHLEKYQTSANPTVAGDVLQYRISVSNTGDQTLYGITISDPGTTLVCPATSTLAPGGHFDCTASKIATQEIIDSGNYSNTAYAATSTGSLNVSSNQVDTTVNATSALAIALTQTSANPRFVGNDITYNIRVENLGGKTLQNVRTSDPAVTVSNCPVQARMAPGAVITCSGRYSVTRDDIANGYFTNVATATSTTDDLSVRSNTINTLFGAVDRYLTLTTSTTQRLTTQSAQLVATPSLTGGDITYVVRGSTSGCQVIGNVVVARSAGTCVIGSRITGYLNMIPAESNDVTITFTLPTVTTPVTVAPQEPAAPAAAKPLTLPNTKTAEPVVAVSDLGSAKTTKAADAASQSLGGFAPGEQTRVEVIGARTTGQFFLSGSAAADPVAIASALQESTQRNAQSFAKVTDVEAIAAPDKSNVVSGGVTDDAINTFAASKLDRPILVGNLPTDANTKWLKIDAAIDTFKPGSVAYAVVTTQPIILGAAVVDEFGKADITGYLPVSILPEGGHNIRIVGARSLGGVTTDANGKVTLAQDTLNEINKFDQGTNATVLVTGKGANGAMNTATLVVELDKNVPWFTLWYIIGSFLAVMLLAAMRLMRRVRARVVFSVGIALSATPALVLGWITSSYEVMGWGALIALISIGLTWFISPLFTLQQDREARQARREARLLEREAAQQETIEESVDEATTEQGHRLAG